MESPAVPDWRRIAAARIAGLHLTPREADIAWGILAGRTSEEIASHLGISEQTVRNNLTAINRQLGTRDRLQIALVLLGILPARDERRHDNAE
jgi:DNA-binding CsgD family transcriptional regulator